MSRLLLPFRRLRWQLTLSYILITLIAALTLEVATTVAEVVAPAKTSVASPAEILVNAMYFTEAPQIVPYLEQTPPDTHGLAIWANIWTPGFTFSKLGFVASRGGTAGSPARAPVGSDSARDVAVVIVDPNGRVLASNSASSPPIEALLGNLQAQAVLHAALLAGKPAPQPVTLADGRTLAAVPVAAYGNGPVLGAFLVAATVMPGPPPPTLGSLPITEIAGALNSVLPSALALVILASIVGTLSGVLTSRRITRRLGRMTQAADAWRQGELDVAVHDAAPDELGRLAQNLDSMAGQLHRLLIEREALAVAEERHRLARDLHDSIKQQLFAVTMLVGSARLDVQEWPETERTLRDAEQIARQAQQELTALIQALRPTALVGKGLTAAVQELCRDWSQRTGIPISVQAPQHLTLPPTTDQELFRVVEEALSNVARHSGASQAWVSIAADQETAILRIEDNGRGFDPDQVERGSRGAGQGLGLGNMRERAHSVGGALHITSGAESTRVEVRVPLAPPREPSEQKQTVGIATSGTRDEPERTEATDDPAYHPAHRR